jgi:hypothetical protein
LSAQPLNTGAMRSTVKDARFLVLVSSVIARTLVELVVLDLLLGLPFHAAAASSSDASCHCQRFPRAIW